MKKTYIPQYCPKCNTRHFYTDKDKSFIYHKGEYYCKKCLFVKIIKHKHSI
jgi:late competence protein required for DNA uptake (superfamily II DNA/RNA helicase)